MEVFTKVNGILGTHTLFSELFVYQTDTVGYSNLILQF